MAAKLLSLTAGLIALVFTCLRFMATRHQRAAAGAGNEGTGQAVIEISETSNRRQPEMPGNRIPSGPQRVHVPALTKSQAEDLLDWLEDNGVKEKHLSYDPANGFTVWYE